MRLRRASHWESTRTPALPRRVVGLARALRWPQGLITIVVVVGLVTVNGAAARPMIGVSRSGSAQIDAELRRVVRDELRGRVALDHVHQLSTFDRTATTEGYHQAIEYVRDAAQRAGLQQLEVIRFPADGVAPILDTYRSGWAWRLGGGELAYEHPDERICRYEDIPTCIVKYSPAANGVFEVVDVGPGTSAAGYAGKDVDGKLVFASAQASAVLAYAAGRHHIAGVISYWDNYLPDRSPFPDQVAWQAVAQDPGSDVFAFSISKRMAGQLQRRLVAGAVRLRAHIDAELFAGEYELLTGVLPGGDLRNEEVLVIAHLNHHRPGANDNASGSALGLEMIGVLARLLERGTLPPLRRSIRFLWVPEHRGTQIFVHQNRDYGERGVAVIDNDMVGADQAESGSIFLLTRPPDSMPSYLNDLMESLLEEVVREQFRSPHGSRNPFHYRVVPYSGAISDHAYFVDRSVGVPAIMLSTDPDNFYHSNEDTADHIDATTLMRAGYVAASVAAWLATAGAAETVPLAQLVGGGALSRLGSTLADSMMRLQQATEFAPTHAEQSNLLRHVAACEIAAVISVKRLGTSPTTARQIRIVEETVSAQATAALLALEHQYQQLINSRGKAEGVVRTPIAEIPGAGPAERAACGADLLQAVPERGLFGPLRPSWFLDNVEAERRTWYEAGHAGGSFREAIVNFADGDRTVTQIHAAVVAELGELPVSDVCRFLVDLVSLDLFSWR